MFPEATRGSGGRETERESSDWRLEDEICSSGSESRGSSAGVGERQDPRGGIVPRPPATSRTRRKPSPSGEQFGQQLSVDIPSTCWFYRFLTSRFGYSCVKVL